MCMKNAQTRNALAVAKIMAIGNVNAGGIPSDLPVAEISTVRVVKTINATNTEATAWARRDGKTEEDRRDGQT